MKNRILVIISIVLPLTVACQKSEDTTLQNGTTKAGTVERPKLVRAADGRMMHQGCLDQNKTQLDAIFQSRGLAAAQAQMDTWCNVKNMAADERQRACAPRFYVGDEGYSNYYYPPAFYGGNNGNYNGGYNNNNTNVNLTFNNYYFNGNGYPMLGYNPQQNYNPYPQGYQQYPYAQPYYNNQPYNYSNYNYGGQYQQGQPFYYNTNYYNPVANNQNSNQFCNTQCANGNGVGCANTCWYGGPSTQYGYNATGTTGNTGATVIQ